MFFPLANLFNQLNVKHSLQNQFPKNPNQSRQFTVQQFLIVRYVSVLQDYTTFVTSENLHYKMFTMR